MSIRRKIRRAVCLLLLLSLCAGLSVGCRDMSTGKGTLAALWRGQDDQPVIGEQGEEEFDQFLDELFAMEIVSDSITLNFYLADPSSFGIELPTPTYGEVATPESIERNLEETEEFLDYLNSFRYESLRADQQIIYDILLRNFDIAEEMEAYDDFNYYLGSIHPVSGIQVQLPILLAEFNFRSVEDIDIYLQLLDDTQRYFGELVGFERERSRRGFFMSDANVDLVIANCESFLENREDNLLIAVFNDKVDRFDGLGAEQRDSYKQRNRELVMNNVFAAYEALIDAMRELRGHGANQGGLADLPNGKEYARIYMQFTTGSDRSPGQVRDLLEDKMDQVIGTMRALFERNSDLMDAYFDGTLGSIPEENPEVYLRLLEKRIMRDFPEIQPIKYTVREVHESLQEFLSPAFFLVPAIDSFDDNVIYINPGSISDNLSLFTTLAHEGYPGHMFQHVYYLQQSPHPLYSLIGTRGYSEGWATYVEMLSYFYTDLSEDESMMTQLSQAYNLLLVSMVDLGINALGWGADGVVSYLMSFGIEDEAAAEEIINMVSADPLSYLPYALGYLEFESLAGEAREILGKDFILKEFHRFVLDIGPVPFSLIRARMQDWANNQTAGAFAPAA